SKDNKCNNEACPRDRNERRGRGTRSEETPSIPELKTHFVVYLDEGANGVEHGKDAPISAREPRHIPSATRTLGNTPHSAQRKEDGSISSLSRQSLNSSLSLTQSCARIYFIFDEFGGICFISDFQSSTYPSPLTART
ncbi:hypothetical protein PFISCL1PPCAC_15539, partial [Pristionchus fissidentatus]